MDAEFDFEIGAMPPVDDAQFERFWTAFSQEVTAGHAAKSMTRATFREEMLDAHQTGLDAMEVLHESALEAINWSSDVVNDALGDDPEDIAFAEQINVLVGLGGRALLAYDEVTWLLRGGYPHGAMT